MAGVYEVPGAVGCRSSFRGDRGLRPAGFFVKTTALSVFGIVCLCFFYASYAANRMQADLHLALISLFLVVLTTSRAGFAAAALILLIGWLCLDGEEKIIVFARLGLAGSAVLLAIDAHNGYRADVLQIPAVGREWTTRRRFIWTTDTDYLAGGARRCKRLSDGDIDFRARIAALIDSGYLNYYLQGTVGVHSKHHIHARESVGDRSTVPARSVSARGRTYDPLSGELPDVGMIVTNPLRSPVSYSFATFAFWKLKYRAGMPARGSLQGADPLKGSHVRLFSWYRRCGGRAYDSAAEYRAIPGRDRFEPVW